EDVALADNSPLKFDSAKARLTIKGDMSTEEREAYLAMSADPAWRTAIDRLWVSSQWDDQAHAAAVAVAPQAADALRPTANFGDMLAWLLWPGVTLMVVSSLVSFSFSWRSMVRAFTGSRTGAGPIEDTGELPRSWFIGGVIVALVVSVILQNALFGILVWAATAGVLLSFALAVVGSRVS